MSPARALPRAALAALAGAAAVLSFAPFGLWWLAPLTLAALFRLAEDSSGIMEAGITGMFFGLGLFGAGVWWIFLCLHQYANFPLPSALALSAVFVIVLSLFPALAIATGRALPAAGRPPRLAALASAWTLTEWLRGFAFTGFPFLSFGYSQIPESPLAGFTPAGGVYATGLAAALVAASLAYLSRPLSSVASAWATGLILLALLSGAATGQKQWTVKNGAVIVSLLQGNVPQDQKWREEEVQAALNDYLALAIESGEQLPEANKTGRLIILPETALPLRLRDIPENYLRDLTRAAGERGGVLAGMFYESGNGIQNAAMGLSEGSEIQIYGKRHLVPYGEYLPFASLLAPFLRASDIPYSELTPGDFPGPISFPSGRIGISICYEDSFGDEWRSQWTQSALLANITNDAWYNDSPMLSQHLQMSQARALESGRWLARATNTGATALLNHRGKIESTLPHNQRGFITEEAQLRAGETPYTRLGSLPPLALSLLILLLSATTPTFHRPQAPLGKSNPPK